MDQETFKHVVEEIVQAVGRLAKAQTGALLVMERETGLNDYMDTGVLLKADVTKELLENLFFPRASLHDGATIIRGDKIYASGCILPLSESPIINRSLGTRHRAALGISEVSDAFVIVVSEESGVVSVAEEGALTRDLDEGTLRGMLMDRVNRPAEGNAFSLLTGWRKLEKRISGQRGAGG
jgi:diadenylate cyclase